MSPLADTVAPPSAVPGLPTLADVLALPALSLGRPEVVAGAEQLGRQVRWAHVAELPQIGGLLRGGEVVLSTGIALPRSEEGLAAFVEELAAVPVAGLVVELGRAYADRLPPAMVRAARRTSLPLVALGSEVAFVEVTEAVHGLVADAQLAQLQAAREVHATFTELALEGAEPQEVVRQAARLAGAPVVLETLAHHVLAHDAAGADPAHLLARWEARSRAVSGSERTLWHPGAGWLVTLVGARGQDWGRLVLVRGDDPGPRDAEVLERAATTLALNRLIARDLDSLERQGHRSLLAALLDHTAPAAELALRAQALGVPLDGRRLLGAVVRWSGPPASASLAAQARLRDLADAVAQACREVRRPALVGTLDEASVGVLATLGPRDTDEALLDELTTALRRVVGARLRDADPDSLLVAAGTVVTSAREARRTLVEALQVADAAAHLPPDGAAYRRMRDVRLRGLLTLLRDDPRLETYVERQLGALLLHDAERGSDLTGALRAYLSAGRNKSLAAAALHLSRPAFYDRVARIESVLGADLDDVETCLALHVALLARDATGA